MLAHKDEALRQIQDFGLDVDFLEIDTPSLKRVKFNGKLKRNLDGFYQVFSFPGTNLVAGYYGTFYGGKTVEKIKGDEKAYSQLSDTQKFKLRNSYKTTQKQVDNFEPDFSIWDKASPCEFHSYLDRKKIKVTSNLKVIGNELLIPFYNRREELVSIDHFKKKCNI